MNAETLLIPAIAFLSGIIILSAVGIWALRQGGEKRTPSDAVPLLSAEQNAAGQWIIRVNGKPYASLKDVPDEAVRQDVLAAMRAIVVFGRDYVRKPAESPARPSSQARATALFVDEDPATRSSRPLTEAPSTPTVADGTRRPTGTPPASSAQPVTPPRPSPASLKARVISNTASSAPTPPREAFQRESFADALLPMLDLAAEIEEIVREMQPAYPSLAQRAIRLQNAPGRGVRVVVDGIVYESVDDVPDADIQALIRAATREWERR